MILQLRNQHYNISTIFLLYVVAIYFSNLMILSFNSHLPIEWLCSDNFIVYVCCILSKDIDKWLESKKKTFLS